MGFTFRKKLRYPEGTELANTLHTQIKNLAEDVDISSDYYRDPVYSGSGVQRQDNLVQYYEGSSSLTGYIVVQTNIELNSFNMFRIHIRGSTYEATNNIIDLIITGYLYGTESRIDNTEAVNRGSFNFSDVKLYTRNSDKKLAIAIGSDSASNYWHIPKIHVDGMFSFRELDPKTQLQSGWSTFRSPYAMSGYKLEKTFANTKYGLAESVDWMGLPTQNSWTSYDTTFPALYRRDAGWVTIQGLVKKSIAPTGADLVATLPVGFRPKDWLIAPGVGYNGSIPALCELRVSPAGLIIIQLGASNTWTSLTGLRFKAV